SLSLALLLILIFLASLDMKVLADIIGKEIGSHEEASKRDQFITVIGVLIFLAALLLIVSIFFDVMLLVGVYNDRKGFIFAWIILQLVFLVIDLINTISTIGHNWAGTFTDLLIAFLPVKIRNIKKVVYGISMGIATSLIVSAIFNSLLLIGIYNNRPHFIHAWIVALIFVIFVDLITVISTLIAQPYNPFLRLCILCINIYCLLIVNSHHVNLKQGSSRIASAPPAYID
ncbi:hypothetical protein LSTR_LSTR007765, partial [Laodelphax striatellus]